MIYSMVVKESHFRLFEFFKKKFENEKGQKKAN